MICVDYILAAFTDIDLKAFEIPKLRGYFAHKYPDEPLLHNHLVPGKFSYQAPRIQYRIYQGHPALIGIGEGIQIVKEMMLDHHQIQIGEKNMTVQELQIEVLKADFGQTPGFQDYRFSSVWMALNQENYRDYIKINSMDQKRRLKQILKGNLLTLSKAFSYTIPDFQSIEVDGWFKPVSRNFHNIPMHCFTGEFTVNFMIPDYLALGKQSARGFGVVQRQKEEKMIHKMHSLFEHIPKNIISAYENEYDLAVGPKADLKVITLDFRKEGSEYKLADSILSDYDSERNVTDYFYRDAPSNTVSPFLSLYISEEGLKATKEEDYSVDSKVYKKFIRILNRSAELNSELGALRDFFVEQSEAIFEELDKYLDQTKKSPYIFTISIDGLHIGRSPLFKAVRENTAEEYYKDFYTLKDKKITGKNMVCSMCMTTQKELWGYVSIYNFYTSKTDFAPIASGLNKDLAHRNYPVCPDCAAKLKKLRPVVDKYFSFKFCGFDYLLIPQVIGQSQDSELMERVIDIMVAQYDSEPGALLNLDTRLGEFSIGKRKKMIDGYSKEVFDYLAETNNAASYTMLFYAVNNAEFKILLTIEDVFPSQFRELYDAKQKAEAHEVFQNLPGRAKGEVYNLEFRFDALKEFLPINDRIEGDFSKAFLETTRNIFTQKQLSFSFLLQRIMATIRSRFSNDQNYELTTRKAFLILKFMSYLGILNTTANNANKEVAMTGKFADFFQEHQDFIDSGAKQCVFMTGVLTQLLINIQLSDKSAAPFRKRLNNMKLNQNLVYRIFTEAKEKLEQYGKNYYRELEVDIAELMVKGGMEKLSNDEISFLFTLGMTLHKKFKEPKTMDQENEQGENHV